jgi:tetrahydromethanopterin S-methyltransferase subunit G
METIFEEQVKSELKSMDHRLFDMEEKINSIDTKLTQVIDAILGNPLTKTGGFMSDLSSLKDRIDTLERKASVHDEFRKKFGWTITIVVAVGAVIQYLIKLYTDVS